MQTRFCNCGHKVYVDYLSDKGKWESVFLTIEQKRKEPLSCAHICPNCGSPLNINQLR